MSVLILGSEDDIHVKLIKQRCPDSFIIDLTKSQVLSASWLLGSSLLSEPLFDDTLPSPGSISTVFWRSVTIPNSLLSSGGARNTFGFLSFFLDCYSHSTWFNDITSFCLHVSKPIQLKMVQQLGVSIPVTMVTSSVDAARQFISQYGTIAVKPVSGGDYTRKINCYNSEEILPIVFSSGKPMIVQEFVEGPNMRTYVIENKVFSAIIESELPDYRIDSSANVIAVSTPDLIAQQAIAITNRLGYRWTAIDWIIDNENRYNFLEANFSPMFHVFSEKTGYAVADELASALQRTR